MFEIIVGNKKAYYASLNAVVSSIAWSLPFFLIAQLVVSLCLVPMVTDLFAPVHLFFRGLMGDNYSQILEEQVLFLVSAVIAVFAGCKYGFKGSADRKEHFFEFTDGFASVCDGLVFHYKSYGTLDFIFCALSSGAMILVRRYLGDILLIFPHFNIFTVIFPSIRENPVLEFLCATLALSIGSVYGAYASQKKWRADILYDLE